MLQLDDLDEGRKYKFVYSSGDLLDRIIGIFQGLKRADGRWFVQLERKGKEILLPSLYLRSIKPCTNR